MANKLPPVGVAGQKKLKKLWRLIYRDDTMQVITIIHDVNPKSTTYCDKATVAGYDSNTEQDIYDKISELGLTYPENWPGV
jgi:hypothetical protein